MKLKSIAKSSLFLQSYEIAKSNISKIGMIVLFDAMFVISFFIIQKLSNYLGMIIIPYISFSPILFLFILSAIYYLVALLVYSFFKFNILDYIKSLFEKTQFNLKKFWNFYLLNLIIAFIFLVILLIINIILMNLKLNYAPYLFLILAIPYLLFLYVIFNISQSLFYIGNSMKESLKKGFKIAFTEMRGYREIIFVIVTFSIVLWLLFLGFGYILRVSTAGNYSMYLNAYSVYSEIVKWVISIVAYILILVNRIAFYNIAKKVD